MTNEECEFYNNNNKYHSERFIILQTLEYTEFSLCVEKQIATVYSSLDFQLSTLINIII